MNGSAYLVDADGMESAFQARQPVHISENAIRILYLDDDDIDRTLMQMHVKRHLRANVELHCVETPGEACKMLKMNEFDYFVTDNRMPPISTYRETLDLLDLETFTGRIIVVSSETRFECFDSEPDARVHRITDKADLSEAIKSGLFNPFR